MPIVPSRSSEIQSLAQGLGQGRAANRESAIARLTLLGERALPTVLDVLKGGESAARVDALAVIEQHRSARARAAVFASTSDSDLLVARRAVEACVHYPDPGTVEVLRGRARSGPRALQQAAAESLLALLGEGLEEAMDPLLDLVLGAKEDEAVRRAALPALRHLSPRERAPLLAQLRKRADDTAAPRLLQQFLEEGPEPGGSGPLKAPPGKPATALERSASETSRVSRSAVDRLVEDGGPAAITALHDLLEGLPRADEKAAQGKDAAAARGHLHRALATLGSRIALYDLRESLAARPPLVPSLLVPAAAVVGDSSLVVPLAALATEAPAIEDLCLAALTAIVRREHLRRTSAAVKAVRPPHRAVLDRLWPRRKESAGPRGSQRSTPSRKAR